MTPIRSLARTTALMFAAACASSSSMNSSGSSMSMSAPSPDPRVGLSAGWFNAGEAIWNLRKVSATRPSEPFISLSSPGDRRLINSDLAFVGNYAIQGNYSGYQVWDISNPSAPTIATSYVCPGSQSDVSVYRNLMFVSAEATNGRVDCGLQGVTDTVSHDRARGIRVFDVTDMKHPRAVATVQTCRGSHTNTLVVDPKDNANVYIYVSGSAGVRSPNEMPGCSGGQLTEDPNTALFRIEVIRVPLAHPELASIVSSPRIFNDLSAPARHAEPAADVAARAATRPAAAPAGPARPPRGNGGPTQCHDITVYPEIGLAGGACAGYGLLLDIHDVANPKRIGVAADSNFSFWHSATFSNDGSKVLFSDEWGGGTQPRCRSTDKMEWGADAIFTIKGNQLNFESYYKMPAAQTANENCVAHNGSLIPVPGREIMVQSWYQGGISIFDWTDVKHPREIAFFDRGPMDSTKLVDAGYWSSYWYNGYIVGSEISRGLDIFELTPSAMLTQNEIDAAKTVHFEQLNVQMQPKLVWPASFVVARAYVDQLARGHGLSQDMASKTMSALIDAERKTGSARKEALSAVAAQLRSEQPTSTDLPRIGWLLGVVNQLAP